MKAVILAAGKGTRMGALTEELPKPMLPVEGKPILEHIISGIAAQGVRELCLIVGWKAEVIQKHFGEGSALGLNITYTTQEVQDGTGKAPELAREFVGDDAFLLTYGDILVRPETYATMVERFGQGEFSGLI
ncbi:MAG: nucleotidyltransferase family protein, partial [Verrucomicrobiota bacterium]|nr:nucleotidyltransferase family protein [Verrucomicrobiota bacterium]